MLYWKANFQIPNSGAQSSEVFVVVVNDQVEFYSDNILTNLLFTKIYDFPKDIDVYDFLLSLAEFSQYTKYQ